MDIKDASNLAKYIVGIAVFTFMFMFFVTASCIGFGVKQACGNAMSKYKGDKVEALLSCVNDEACGLKKRNEAVWALGQLGDKRALADLEKRYNPIEKDLPCRNSSKLCGYGLRKAITLIKGGVNITAFVWR